MPWLAFLRGGYKVGKGSFERILDDYLCRERMGNNAKAEPLEIQKKTPKRKRRACLRASMNENEPSQETCHSNTSTATHDLEAIHMFLHETSKFVGILKKMCFSLG